ncbi:MAG: hypothetical protein COA79_09055 [Planctomycetota bacterium]|nr:MAG: hypothetical protein COA79_09055 [Planctomycetota bacterium]
MFQLIKWTFLADKDRDMHNNQSLLTTEQQSAFRIIESYPFNLQLLNYFEGDKPGWSHGKNLVKNQTNTLYFIAGGDGFMLHEGKKIPLKADQIYFIPSDISRGFGCKTKISKYYIMFGMSNILGRDLFHGLNKIVCLGPWRKIFLPIFKKGLTNNAMYYQLQFLIMKLLTEKRMVEEGIQNINHKEERYRKLFRFIEDNLSARITVAELSEIMDLSTQGLSRAFHRDMGQTLKSFLNDRINKSATDYLIHTDLMVKEISEAMRFDDEYYFNRFFKKMNNKTPLTYRKQFRRMPY